MALDATRLKASMKANIEALTDFPLAGQSPIIQDDRVLGAIAQAIIDEIQGNADVLPATHGTLPLQNPSGQAVAITSGPGSGSTGDTSAPQVIVGTGSIQ